MYKLDKNLFSEEPDLADFFTTDRPEKTRAKSLQPGYTNGLYDSEDHMVGIETISPITISILLNKWEQFVLLIDLLIDKIQNSELKPGLDTLCIMNTVYHALDCALQEENIRVHQYLTEHAEIKAVMNKNPSLFHFISTFYTKETKHSVLAVLSRQCSANRQPITDDNKTTQNRPRR